MALNGYQKVTDMSYSTIPYTALSNENLLRNKNNNYDIKVTVLIGFYNNLTFLKKQLECLTAQSFKSFEIIICDDGSKPEVVSSIHSLMSDTKIFITHLWQTDSGWRKVELLNKALLHARGDYIITIDQDCLLHTDFIKEHFSNKSIGSALAGRRVELSPWISQLIFKYNLSTTFISKYYPLISVALWFNQKSHWYRGLHIKNKYLRSLINNKTRKILGCNVSFFKSDITEINGYEMLATSPVGAEDTDLDIRFRNKGLKIISLCNIAVQYHMWHKENKNVNEMPVLFKNNYESKTILATNGLDSIKKTTTDYL